MRSECAAVEAAAAAVHLSLSLHFSAWPAGYSFRFLLFIYPVCVFVCGCSDFALTLFTGCKLFSYFFLTFHPSLPQLLLLFFLFVALYYYSYFSYYSYYCYHLRQTTSTFAMGHSNNGAKRRLLFMLLLTTSFFLIEIIVGYITNSMALVADSFHMLSDVIALVIAYVSVRMSPKKWSKNTFGWARAEVLGALVNAVFLCALCFSILVESVKRFYKPEFIHDAPLIMIVGLSGLLVNVIGLFLFKGKARSFISQFGCFFLSCFLLLLLPKIEGHLLFDGESKDLASTT